MPDDVNDEWLDRMRSEIGEDAVGEVIALFLEETRDAAARLPSLDRRGRRDMLHFLTGSAANLGFEGLGADARAAMADGRTARSEAMSALAARFADACDVLEARAAA